jgi:purine-nucleoside phosphorylase
MAEWLATDLPQSLATEATVDVAIVLGSGFSAVADDVKSPRVVEYGDIEGFPMPMGAVPGHEGRLLIGTLGGKRAAVFSGRVHCYQGFSARQAAHPVLLAHALGAQTLVVTNASGGIDDDISPGDIVVIGDHLNLGGDSPLIGATGPGGATQFVGMTDAYDPELRALALVAAADADVDVVADLTYAWLRGPAYETPAEVEMLRRLGAGIVGMSTVPEVIAARALGLRVLGLSLVTNMAAGAAIAHDDVLDAGRAQSNRVRALVLAILQRLP